VASLPEPVRRFIRRNINSVELLDVLLLLRARSERAWTARELSDELRSSPNSIARRLEHLGRRRLTVRAGDGHRYAASGETDEVVQLLGDAYQLRRSAVIDEIFSEDPLQSFSDAFKVRDDE